MTALTPELVERVLALRAAGRSMTAIGAELGLTKNQVAGMLYRLRHANSKPVPPQRPPRPPWYGDCPAPGACSWPVSEGRPWRFCAQDREPGGVYCTRHRQMASGGTRYVAEAAA